MAEGNKGVGMVSNICINWPEKEILLVLNDDKEKPSGFWPSGIWGLSGGKMKNEETVEKTALRELGQETIQDGQTTKYCVEIPKVGPDGPYIHTFMLVRITSEGKELKNNENPKAIPKWIPFGTIFSGRVTIFRSHIQGLKLVLEKMAEKKISRQGKVDRNGVPILSEGPSSLLETLDEFRNAFDEKGKYIIPFLRRR